jgi:type IV secretion system protein VirB4
VEESNDTAIFAGLHRGSRCSILGRYLYGHFSVGVDEMKAQNSLYAPYRWVDERTFLTKSAELVRFYRLQGIEFECSTDDAMEDWHHRLETVILSLPEGIRVKFYWTKVDRVSIPRPQHPNPVVQETIENRADFLENGSEKLYSMELHLALVFEPEAGFALPFIGRVQKISRRKLVKQQAALSQAESILKTVDELLELKPMSREDVFEYLAFLSTMDADLAKSQRAFAAEETQIDRWMTTLPARTNPWNGIRIGRIQPVVLSLDKPPDRTWPNSLRPILAIPGKILIAAEWKKEPIEKSVKKLKSAEGWFEFVMYFRNIMTSIRIVLREGDVTGEKPDKKVEEDKERANAERLRLQSGKGATHGWMGYTAICFSEKAEENEKAALGLQTLFANQLGRLIREHGYAYGPFLNLVPGTTPKYRKLFRQRVRKYPLNQFLDLAPVYNHSRGFAVNHVTGKSAHLQLVSTDRTVIDFNLIPPDISYVSVLGVGLPGSGKSTLSQLLIDTGMKDDPYVLILDGLGGSYRMLTQKHNGDYYDMDPEGEWKFTLNPCQIADTKNNRRYLSMFLQTCFATGGYKRTAQSSLEIYNAVRRLLSRPMGERRLRNLELPVSLQPHLAPWIGEGEYSHVFDNGRDTLHLSTFTCIDFSKLLTFPDIVAPFLFHICHHWDQIIYDEKLLTRPKILYGDEIHALIEYEAARRYILWAARSWRKRLGGLVLWTQSTQEYKKAKMFRLIRELCPLSILLKNPNQNIAEYAKDFHLNESESLLYRNLTGVGSGLVKSAKFSKAFQAPIDPEALWYYRNDPMSNDRRNRALEQHKGDLRAAIKALAKGAA